MAGCMKTPGINNETFEIVLEKDWFKQNDILHPTYYVLKVEPYLNYSKIILRDISYLEEDYNHFLFLCKYNLLEW